MKTTIRDYYDSNTRRFLRFSPAGSAATIHRAVWAEGVTGRTQAVHYVHDLLLRYAPEPSGAPEGPDGPMVWDLGCGVGASIVYLATRRKASYRGLTISGVQQELATRHLQTAARGCSAGITLADFCDPAAIATLCRDGKPDLVYMIESFAHATRADELIRAVAGALQPGGRFAICDDLLAHRQARDEPLVRRFRHGWRIETLLTADELAGMAKNADLRPLANLNLTPFVENNRPRDRLIRRLVALADRTGFSSTRTATRPFWLNMFGGDALQQATNRGMIEYRFMVFEKPV